MQKTLARAPMSTLRAKDVHSGYVAPRKSLRDAVARGEAHRIAHGYYCAVPLDANPGTWLPSTEAAAAGVAAAIWGDRVAILMGLSAARAHLALPRAVSDAYVAVPNQHRPIPFTDRSGTIRFVMRDVAALDAVLVRTDLGQTLVTSAEQTALDLARRDPDFSDPDVVGVIKALLVQSDLRVIEEIANGQGRMRSALRRVRGLA